MGSRTASTGNDRSRTYWTPSMERYFVDLMLEQMHRGNRCGHTFNKQAWTDMLTVFNQNFGSQYDKDVLKSRYTNLWKQFNEVQSLLGHTGFSWDEAQQMVVADDYVWDAYIKVNPDAKPYKTKAVLNFNDLYLIYGYTNADGRYSRSSHDLDIDEEMQGLGDGNGGFGPSSTERPRTEWTIEMDRYFIELMIDQIGRGNKTADSFSKQAWTDMLALFNAKFFAQHGKRVLRHRYKKLCKYYNDTMNLLQQDGFSWNEMQQMVVADDDVWDNYIKAHPFARAYRMKTLPNYYDLVLIYGNKFDNGSQSRLLEKNVDHDLSRVKTAEASGNQIMPTNSDRTRTYWTPPMDRYLIDLLLEQVHRGNKVGQTFITQAWGDMVTSFNGQFRSNHDKDVLKNRYKHLKRLYNEIKILLERKEFSWDEKREIVTADDHVWDAYIKEHPDARSYRVKTVPSYHKLCIIFGEESPDRRYSRLAHYADPANELPILISSDIKSEEALDGEIPLGIDWTLSMDHYFIDLMIEQLHLGNIIGETFNDQAWALMVLSFNEKFGLKCDKSILEDRHRWLMEHHHDIGNLLNYFGFFWDETQELVMANNDVWEAYGKENPDALSYKTKFLNHYSEVCKIFGIIVKERLSDQNTWKTDENSSLGTEMYEISVKVSDQERKRPFETAPDEVPCKKKVNRTDQEMKKALSEMAGVVTKLMNGREGCSRPVEGAITALQAIPDIDDDLMLDACDLFEDERKAKTFLALDAALRMKWLLRKLRP